MIYMLVRIVDLLFTALSVAMLIRAVTSWFPGIRGSWLDFIYTVTEFVVAPVRALLEKFDFFRNSPIDLSFTIAYVLIIVLQNFFKTFAGAVLL